MWLDWDMKGCYVIADPSMGMGCENKERQILIRTGYNDN